MNIQFIGGVGTVTGSKYLVTQGKTKVLVDCGLFQGLKVLRQRNWKSLPFEVGELDAVVLTHAHLDHSGYLPVLFNNGFQGNIYCTPPTRDLCEILLPDSGHLQEEDARYANKKGFSKHSPALPLYTEAQAREVFPYFQTVMFGEELEIGELRCVFQPIGHILGASSVIVSNHKSSLLFSGDIGRPTDFLMRTRTNPDSPDWIVMESTYGDRNHSDVDPISALGQVVQRTIDRAGVLLIPAFAVGRTQSMLYCLNQIFERGIAPRVPVYVNSPMATDVTKLYQKYHRYHALTEEECQTVCSLARFVRSEQDSKKLNELSGPAVVISASGMLTGGRVLHHLKAFAPRPENTIMLTGYQAPGTRGSVLASGARHIKVHGEYVQVKAEVVQIDFLSAHADQQELLAWLAKTTKSPRGVIVVHGESTASDALRYKIKEKSRLEAFVPDYLESVKIG